MSKCSFNLDFVQVVIFEYHPRELEGETGKSEAGKEGKIIYSCFSECPILQVTGTGDHETVGGVL